ncbi:MAG: GMC family oxidoreductase [Myxococcales bacterium]|nr:GMC family oxidoreductase [Myxococcales bacterium]
MTEIEQGREIRGDQRRDCDVVVIGSGGGGAVAAYELASAGLDVLVLEAGPWIKPEEFTQREIDTITRVYVDQGTQGAPDGSISVLQGECIGGSTVVNGEVCFRTPDFVLAEWAERFGVRDLSAEELKPIFAHVEEMINVTTNSERFTTHAEKAAAGLAKLGLNARPIDRNVKNCRGCCYCFFGCAYGCKQSVDQSYLPRAMDKGARVIAEARVGEIRLSSGAASGVVAKTRNGRLDVRAKQVVVACGAIATPLLLSDNGLGGTTVGQNLSLHPVVFVSGFFRDTLPERPQTMLAVYCDDFLEQGFLAEFGSGSRAFSAQGMPGFGREHRTWLNELHNAWSGGAIIRDDGSTGRVYRDKKGAKVIDYKLTPKTRERLRAALKQIAEVNFAAGASRVFVPTIAPTILDSPDDLSRFDQLPLGPADITLVSYHPQGTAPIGRITDNDGRVLGTDNVYVMDTSLFPTPTGVNPQVSVMAVVTVMARKLAGRMGH